MLGDFAVHGTVTREERDAQVKVGIGSFLTTILRSDEESTKPTLRACQNCGGFSKDGPCCSLGTDCYSCMDCCCPDCHSCKNFHCKCTDDSDNSSDNDSDNDDSSDSDGSTDSGESQTDSDDSN